MLLLDATSTKDFAGESMADTLADHDDDIVLLWWDHYVIGDELATEEERQCGDHEDCGHSKSQWVAVTAIHALHILTKDGRDEGRDKTACVYGNVKKTEKLFQLNSLFCLELVTTKGRDAWFYATCAKGNKG